VLCFLASPIHSNAQAGSPAPAADANDDLLKMISAGLPESVVIAKIMDNSRHWDTSVDALIVLKRAGATEAEIAALAAGPQAAFNPALPMATSFMGGAIRKTLSGDPMLSFPPDLPTRFLDARPTNTAFLVNYKGSPSILVPAIRFIPNCCYAVANVLFLHDKLVFDFYVWEKIGAREATDFSKITNPKMFPEAGNPPPLEVTRTGLLLQDQGARGHIRPPRPHRRRTELFLRLQHDVRHVCPRRRCLRCPADALARPQHLCRQTRQRL
jgi:hypothetical protein